MCHLLSLNVSSFNVYSLTLLVPSSARLKKSPTIRNKLFGPEAARGLRYKPTESKPKRFVWVETTATGGPFFASPSSPSASASWGLKQSLPWDRARALLYQCDFWRDTTAISRKQGQKASLLKCKWPPPPVEISFFFNKDNSHFIYHSPLKKSTWKGGYTQPMLSDNLHETVLPPGFPIQAHNPLATESLEERELFSVLFWFMDS